MPHASTREELRHWAKEVWEKITGHKEEEEVTIKGWVVREQCGTLRFGTQMPINGKDHWSFNTPCWIVDLPYFELKNRFNNVKWSDEEPTHCEITIKIKK